MGKLSGLLPRIRITRVETDTRALVASIDANTAAQTRTARALERILYQQWNVLMRDDVLFEQEQEALEQGELEAFHEEHSEQVAAVEMIEELGLGSKIPPEVYKKLKLVPASGYVPPDLEEDTFSLDQNLLRRDPAQEPAQPDVEPPSTRKPGL